MAGREKPQRIFETKKWLEKSMPGAKTHLYDGFPSLAREGE